MAMGERKSLRDECDVASLEYSKIDLKDTYIPRTDSRPPMLFGGLHSKSKERHSPSPPRMRFDSNPASITGRGYQDTPALNTPGRKYNHLIDQTPIAKILSKAPSALRIRKVKLLRGSMEGSHFATQRGPSLESRGLLMVRSES